MRKIKNILENIEFESSSQKTEQFSNFVKLFKAEFKKELAKIGTKDIKFSVGHFEISGFFRTANDKLFYFSLSDVRSGAFSDSKLMYRTAEHEKDFQGGSNRWVKIDSGMAEQMELQ